MTALRRRSVIALVALVSALVLPVGGVVWAENRPVPYGVSINTFDLRLPGVDKERCYLCNP